VNAVLSAAEGKGFGRMLRRGGDIGGRYGLTTGKMNGLMARFARLLSSHGCGATFPLTAVALSRNHWNLDAYRALNIEFAVHGLCHVDHSRLELERQLEQLNRAKHLFAERGIARPGFRGPYLRWSEDTLAAVRQLGFAYDSSQSLAWPVVEGIETATYRHVLRFYRARSADDYPALPFQEDGLVRMPYSLPDDEALVERLALPREKMADLWLAILRETYRRGELFVVGLHPERIVHCEWALRATLQAARNLMPGVWIARLDEIATWWAARAETQVTSASGDGQKLRLRVSGPPGVTVLARGVAVSAATEKWDGTYRRVCADEFEVAGEQRPFIGLSARSSPRLTSFLRQQGYIVEPAAGDSAQAIVLDAPEFTPEDERSLLARIEEGVFPLVRLGRWPNGHRSALSITGDIDALTLFDYGLRLFGR
jgi:peptidoglycan/xylan/chitin deacetylase (PgdA/CDA1 family)